MPPLHPGQHAVLDDPTRFKVVVCGRQWGKTLLGAVMVVQEAVKGGDVWWVAPSYPIAELGWHYISWLVRQIAEQVPGIRFEGRPTYRITFPTGGTIQLRSADNPDSLRGATLNGVVFDEAAQAKPNAWSTLRPTLSVRQGWALFISTPKGLNWFHDLYQDAEKLEGWQTWRFPSVDSPFQRPDEVATARREMGSLEFSQEFEAEFISYGSGMFRQDWIQHYYIRWIGDQKVYHLGENPIRHDELHTFQTVDLAWGQSHDADYTVISTWGVTPMKHLLLLDVDRGRYEIPEVVSHVRIAYERHRPSRVIVEHAARQIQLVKDIEQTGIPMKAVKPEKDKEHRAAAAISRMEQKTVWFPPASEPYMPDIVEELLAFPVGRHDDFVDTFAYACLQLSKRPGYEDHGLRTV